MSALNQEIRQALDHFDVDKARVLLREALPEANAETYFLAARASIDDDQKLEFLDKALQVDPFYEPARNLKKRLQNPGQPAPQAAYSPPPQQSYSPPQQQSYSPPPQQQPTAPQPGMSNDKPLMANINAGALIVVAIIGAIISAAGNLLVLEYFVTGRPSSLSEFRMTTALMGAAGSFALIGGIAITTKSFVKPISMGTVILAAVALAGVAFAQPFVNSIESPSEGLEWVFRILEAGIVAFVFSELNVLTSSSQDRRWSIPVAFGTAFLWIVISFASVEITESLAADATSLDSLRTLTLFIGAGVGATLGAIIYSAFAMTPEKAQASTPGAYTGY